MGTYNNAILQGTLTAGANYNLNYVPASFTINPPTVGMTGNASTPAGSPYALTLSVPTTFAAAGDSTAFIVVSWNDPANDPNLVPGGSNGNVLFFASPAGFATGNGSGSDPADLMAFPANGILTHDYTDATAISTDVGITVDLVTNKYIDFGDAGAQTVDVQDVPPTAYLGGGNATTVGNTSSVYLYGQSDPSPEVTAAGFRYAYQVYYASNLVWSQGSAANYASGVTNSTLTIPAQYLEAPGVTLDAYVMDKNGGSTQDIRAITVNDAALSVSTGGNVTASSGTPFTQNVTFNYPDTSGLSTFTAYLYAQGNPTPLASVSGVQPAVPFNIGYTFPSPGSNTLYVTISNTVGATGNSSNFNVTVQNPVLAVTSLGPLTSGFAVTFNRAVNTSVLNLYDGLISNSVSPAFPTGDNSSLGSADLTLVGQTTGARCRGPSCGTRRLTPPPSSRPTACWRRTPIP